MKPPEEVKVRPDPQGPTGRPSLPLGAGGDGLRVLSR